MRPGCVEAGRPGGTPRCEYFARESKSYMRPEPRINRFSQLFTAPSLKQAAPRLELTGAKVSPVERPATLARGFANCKLRLKN